MTDFLLGTLADITGRIEALGPWGYVALLGLFAVSGGLSLAPRPILCVVAGAVYGYWGFALAFSGISIGTSAAYAVGRRFSDRMVFLSGRYPSIMAVIAAVHAQGWRAVLLIRLVPSIPSALISFTFGLSRVRFIPYCLATLAGVAPGIVMGTFVGIAGGTMMQGGMAVTQLVFVVLGLIAGAVALYLIIRQARRNIKVYLGHSDRPE